MSSKYERGDLRTFCYGEDGRPGDLEPCWATRTWLCVLHLRGNETHKTSQRPPAGRQLSHTKRYEGRPSPQRQSVSAWQPFKPCFPFHLHKSFYVWISGRHVSLCVCLFSRLQSSDSPPFYSHFLADADSGEWAGLLIECSSPGIESTSVSELQLWMH